MYNSNFLPLFKELSNEEHIIANLCVQNIKRVNYSLLDVGIGNGKIGSLIKLKSKCDKLVGIEPNPSSNASYKCYDEVILEKFENLQIRHTYDYVVLSHILGHIPLEGDFRYSNLMNKIIDHTQCKIFIATNAVVQEFKDIQETIWDYFDDYSYYIDLEKLLCPIADKYFINILPFIAIVKVNNKNLLYNILEVFSPHNFPQIVQEKLFAKLDKLKVSGGWALQIPQFFITIDLSSNLNNKLISKEILSNHEKLWEAIFNQ